MLCQVLRASRPVSRRALRAVATRGFSGEAHASAWPQEHYNDFFRGDPEDDPLGYELDKLHHMVRAKLKNDSINSFYGDLDTESKDHIKTKIENGLHVVTIKGETVVVPDCENTIEWVLSSPVEYHCFEEVPVIKESDESPDEE